MAKKDKKEEKTNVAPVDVTKFEMTTADGKPFNVVAPDSSLDKHAESALNGVYRTC